MPFADGQQNFNSKEKAEKKKNASDPKLQAETIEKNNIAFEKASNVRVSKGQ